MSDAPREVHSSMQNTGDMHDPAGHGVDHHMLFNRESSVTFREVGPSVPKARIAGDYLKSRMEGSGVELLLPFSIGFICVLQDALNVLLGLPREVQGIAFRGGHRDCRSCGPAWRVARHVDRSAP